MLHYVNIWPIIRDHFRPYRYGEARSFNGKRFTFFFVLPLVIAGFLTWRHPIISDRAQGTFLAVYSIIAAVLISLLPVVQNVVGISKADHRYSQGEAPLFRQQVIRLQVLRELYAEICYAVVLLIISLCPLLCVRSAWIPVAIQLVCVAFVYFVAACVSLAFFHIVAGIYLVLDFQAHEINKRLQNNAPTDSNDAERAA